MKAYTHVKTAGVIAALLLVGCSHSSSRTQVTDRAATQEYERQIPGVTEFVWEEPMVDSVDVPPGLDPEGHYYRPAHQEIVEIRQGRWKPHKKQD